MPAGIETIGSAPVSGQRQNSASRMMIGNGMPISHNNTPRPKPIIASIRFGWSTNGARCGFPTAGGCAGTRHGRILRALPGLAGRSRAFPACHRLSYKYLILWDIQIQKFHRHGSFRCYSGFMNKSSVKRTRSPGKARVTDKKPAKGKAARRAAAASAARSVTKSVSKPSTASKPASLSKPSAARTQGSTQGSARGSIQGSKSAAKPVAAKLVAAKLVAAKSAAKLAAKFTAKPVKPSRQATPSIVPASAMPTAAAIELAAVAAQHRMAMSLSTPPLAPAAAAAPTHKFQVGQTVYYNAPTFGRAPAPGNFTVVKLLPSEGDEHQYRIKSNGEAFERVAKESQLEVT